MKKLSIIFTLAGLLLTLAGCPYESAFPIEEKPTESVNPALLGTWRVKNYPKDSTTFIIEQKSPMEYDITATLADVLPMGGARYNVNHFTAYSSTMGRHQVFSVKDEGDKYILVVVEVKGDKMNIKPLSEKFTKTEFKSAAQVKEFLSTYLAQPDRKILYDSDSEMKGLVKVK